MSKKANSFVKKALCAVFQMLCTRQNGRLGLGKLRCYRRLHDFGRSSDNFENLVHFHSNSVHFIGLEE